MIQAQSSKRLGKITSTVTAFSRMSKLALPLCKAKANEKIRAFVFLGSLRTYGRRAQPIGESVKTARRMAGHSFDPIVIVAGMVPFFAVVLVLLLVRNNQATNEGLVRRI